MPSAFQSTGVKNGSAMSFFLISRSTALHWPSSSPDSEPLAPPPPPPSLPSSTLLSPSPSPSSPPPPSPSSISSARPPREAGAELGPALPGCEPAAPPLPEVGLRRRMPSPPSEAVILTMAAQWLSCCRNKWSTYCGWLGSVGQMNCGMQRAPSRVIESTTIGVPKRSATPSRNPSHPYALPRTPARKAARSRASVSAARARDLCTDSSSCSTVSRVRASTVSCGRRTTRRSTSGLARWRAAARRSLPLASLASQVAPRVSSPCATSRASGSSLRSSQAHAATTQSPDESRSTASQWQSSHPIGGKSARWEVASASIGKRSGSIPPGRRSDAGAVAKRTPAALSRAVVCLRSLTASMFQSPPELVATPTPRLEEASPRPGPMPAALSRGAAPRASPPSLSVGRSLPSGTWRSTTAPSSMIV
mmetsp:Transcript_16680/g.49727  ORF Transcript_16680/g.49727 Transcript_16680/m.49727 type:complete len:421 (-) Transcript_16680:508-1770(-)